MDSHKKTDRFSSNVSNHLLDLHGQLLVDMDMEKVIIFLNNHPEILSVNLSFNNIGNTGATYFAEKNKTAEFVNFNYNLIDDVGIKALLANTFIKHLKIDLNKMSDDMLVKLKKDLRSHTLLFKKTEEKTAETAGDSKSIEANTTTNHAWSG